MSKVSKLAIKACRDNKFSSFTGEFNTSINPEHLIIKSGIAYHIPQGMSGTHLMYYRDSPPKLLSFSLLFDNTGIIPGSNDLSVMEQVKQLQDIVYNVPTKGGNGPNYIRIIWGEVDFKGRLVELDISYTRFQVDGMLLRAEAHIAVLEEIVPSGSGKTAVGVDSTYVPLQGKMVQAPAGIAHSAKSNEAVFASTPDGMDGAYSGAPVGAYDGGPDTPYQAGSSSVVGSGMGAGDGSTASIGKNAAGEAGIGGGDMSGKGNKAIGGGDMSGKGNKAIGGGDMSGKGNKASGVKLDSDRSKMIHSSNKIGIGGSSGKLDSLRKLKTVGAAGLAAAGGVGAVALAGKLALSKIKDQLSWWQRLKMLAKKVVPKAYDAGKKVASKAYDAGKKVTSKVAK
ncbi:hypothetical protein [Candidatus Cardinium hertigii]|uniref:Contractile injection system tube protein N-terminal domain-containing protein n=1 Tax=Candidatus Cardinium hertigii TaxID=247481 RepID=A0A2Z3LJ97_9BACT|nr:hypothetical protein [Candidatus Cardinium hertigii]AWN82120.1 hypothetical protein DK880_00815 [Candidatus Cardinium hertigii]